MSDDEISVKRIARAGLESAWLVQGHNCYAIINDDGTKKTYAKGVKPGEPFKVIVAAVAAWCARSHQSTALKP